MESESGERSNVWFALVLSPLPIFFLLLNGTVEILDMGFGFQIKAIEILKSHLYDQTVEVHSKRQKALTKLGSQP